jgi:hypothetical protein
MPEKVLRFSRRMFKLQASFWLLHREVIKHSEFSEETAAFAFRTHELFKLTPIQSF